MFSGIIRTVVSVHKIKEENSCKTYSVIFPNKLLKNTKIGSSIANNGCCLTVVSITQNLVKFHVIYETLKLTNMNLLKIGDQINIEKPIRYYELIDGHLMTGHIDCMGEIKKIIRSKDNSTIMWIKINSTFFKKYILLHGSIGIDGVSVTINRIFRECYIRICLTPYTVTVTNLGIKKIGNIVNIEIDFIVKTIINNVEKTLLNNNFKKFKSMLYVPKNVY